MRLFTPLAALAALMLAGCQTFMPADVSVAEYCADPDNARRDVCRANVEINGMRTALADTDLRLSEARAIANSALANSERAQRTANSALRMADEANRKADRALLSSDDLQCETRVLNQTDTGSCRPGYTLMSCTQTRYTSRAGGLSFLREVNDQSCRFNSQVLEMHVRCCRAAPNASRPVQASYLRGGN